MNHLKDIAIIGVIIAFQTFAGYRENKYLGAILPLAFLAAVGVFLYRGALGFNFKDIVMPFVGLFVLIMLYEGGKESRKSKINKELEKMKAKDISKRK